MKKSMKRTHILNRILCLDRILCLNKMLWLSLIALFIGGILAGGTVAETEQPSAETADAAVQREEQHQKTDAAAAPAQEEGEEINGSADNLERYEKDGITILTGNVKILRTDGYLNADKVTFYTDPITGDTVRTVAESNVEIRDAEIFATCEHATMNHLTNTIILKTDVVVLQNKDRLETVLFTYNRTTGEQTAEGDVKFKVRVIEAEPVQAAEAPKADAASGETAESDAAEKTNETAETAPEEGENPAETETPSAEGTADGEPAAIEEPVAPAEGDTADESAAADGNADAEGAAENGQQTEESETDGDE